MGKKNGDKGNEEREECKVMYGRRMGSHLFVLGQLEADFVPL
jgi:hypothetical protein